MPGGFDQRPARMGVAGLGDRAAAGVGTAGVLGRCESEVVHELPGVVEAVEVTDLGDQGGSIDQLHAA